MVAADAAAQAAGLRVGMAATKAQVLVPGLLVQDADPAADAEALDRLALWALRQYAPIAAADPPDGESSSMRLVPITFMAVRKGCSPP